MVRIAPFRGVLYSSKKIRNPSRVIAPPYDVISAEEQQKLYQKSPYNIVHLDLNQQKDAYETVAQLFTDWQTEGVLVRDETPAIYFLSHRFPLKDGGEKIRQGFIVLAQLEDLSNGKIHAHEKTHEGPKEDRLRLMLACHAHLSPIFALYSQPKQTVNHMLAEHVQGISPLLEVKEDNGGACSLWRIVDREMIGFVRREMQEQPLLIADGHHRYEASLNYRNHIRKEREQWSGREAFNFVMVYLANLTDDNLVILPTHRLINGFDPIPFQELEETLQRFFYLEPYPKTAEGRRWFLRALRSGGKKRHLIGASFKRDPRYLILRLKNKRIIQRLAKDLSAPLQELDVTILHSLILEHILGLNQEKQTQEGVIRYSQDEDLVLDALDKEDYQAAFILNPPKAEEVSTIAFSREKMPQKSTYFYPKLVTGMVINKIDPGEEILDDSDGN